MSAEPRADDFRSRSTFVQVVALSIGRAGARFPIPALLAVGLATLLLGIPAARIDYSDDILGFLPEDHPEVVRFRELGTRFGGLSVGLIGALAPEGDLFTHDRLALLRRITKEVADVEGVAFGSGLTELRDIAIGREEVAVVSELVGELPPRGDREAYQALKRRVLSRTHLHGALISADGAACLILANLAPDADHKRTADAIRARVDALVEASAGTLEMHYGGAPFIGSYVAAVARADIVRLTPWVSAAIILIILLTARSVLGALIALSSVGVAIVWVMGMLALAGRPLTLVSSSLPMLLVALGSAYSIHLLTKVLSLIDGGASRADAVDHAIREVGPPVVVAGVTTALGFLSFLVMNIAPMREFGLWMAVGTLVVVVLGLLVVPAACVLLPLRPRPGGRTPKWAFAAMVAAARGVAARPLMSVTMMALVAFTASLFISRVPGAMDMRAFFAEGSEPVVSEDFLDQRLGGAVFLQIEARGDLKSPLALRQLERLVHTAEASPVVSTVQSVLVPVVLAAEGLTGEARVPFSDQATRAIAALVEDDPNLKLIVDREWRHALVQIQLRSSHGRGAVELARGLRETTLGGGRAAVKRASLTPRQAELERDEVLAHLKLVAPGVAAATLAHALGRGATLSPRQLEGVLRADIEEDELVYVKEGTDLGALALELTSELQRGALDVATLRRALAAVADPEELESPVGFDKAVAHIHEHLDALTRNALTDARTEAVLAAAPDASPVKTRRAVAVLAAPYAALPIAQAQAPDATAVVDFTVSGYPLVYEGMNEAVQRNQTLSLIVSMVLVVLTLSLFFGSLRVGVAASLPAGLTLLVMFAVMGALRIPMDVGTSMIASIALGVGIDYAVHLVWRHGVPAPGAADAALVESLGATGWGIVINALEVTLGFGLLVFGTLVPTQNVGLLTAIAMMVSATSTLVLVPALVRWAVPVKRSATA